MGHRAPEPLKFKFETNLGAADISGKRLLASFNFYALYYLKGMNVGRFRPYVEGGAGVVYSDFQLEGQGLRWNFNPQAGIGLQWYGPEGMNGFAALHAYHISNGGLHSDNRGINGLLFQLGIFSEPVAFASWCEMTGAHLLSQVYDLPIRFASAAFPNIQESGVNSLIFQQRTESATMTSHYLFCLLIVAALLSLSAPRISPERR